MKSNDEQIASLKLLRSTGSISEEEYQQMILMLEEAAQKEDPSDEEQRTDLMDNQSGRQQEINVPIPQSAKDKIRRKIFLVTNVILLVGFLIMAYLYNDLRTSKDFIYNDMMSYYEEELGHLNNRIDQIGKLQPFIVTKLDVVNLVYDNGEFKKEQKGRKTGKYTLFDAQKVDYIALKIDYYGIQEDEAKVFIKLIGPDGLFYNSEVSPKGYSTDDDIQLFIGDQQETTSGWGNEDGGSYDRGNWRAELWLEGKIVPEAIAYFKVI